MQKLIECVPNFSEGRDQNVIRQITDAIESVDGVSLLDVDPGASTNRTVVTFVGSPDAAVEAAFRAIKKASELIDMRKHKGAHPRMGATDVCPFIPVSNVSWDEVIACANRLGQRVGDELKIPIYLYEKAAKNQSRSNLSVIRGGEYEGFFEKIRRPEWKPDFGPEIFSEKSGATVIGVRDFLVAYNVNLNTKSVRRANSVAFDVREQGRVKTEDGTPSGKPVLDANREPIRIPGMLKHVKAIGWFVKEYGIAQVSMNLTDIEETPLHAAFDACCESAARRGLRVTGSEIVGMGPKKSLGDAGRYFLSKQKWSEGVADEEFVALVDEDTAAFPEVMDAFALPKESAEEKAARAAAIAKATKYAAEVPLKVMETASKSYELLAEMAERGNPASVSDIGVGALATRACIEGAALNVKINLAQLKDEKFKTASLKRIEQISTDSDTQFEKISQVVASKLR